MDRLLCGIDKDKNSPMGSQLSVCVSSLLTHSRTQTGKQIEFASLLLCKRWSAVWLLCTDVPMAVAPSNRTPTNEQSFVGRVDFSFEIPDTQWKRSQFCVKTLGNSRRKATTTTGVEAMGRAEKTPPLVSSNLGE